MSENTAPIKWAQRSDSLYITIDLRDVKDETINLTDEGLTFTGVSGDQSYSLSIKFFKPVDSKAEGSTYKVLPRSVQMHVMKKNKEEEFWPRLLEDKHLEKNQVSVDWSRYVDEDEEEDEGGFDTSALEGGRGMGGFGGMPGMEGLGGMDMEALMKQMGGLEGMQGLGNDTGEVEPDSDDDDEEDLPELE